MRAAAHTGAPARMPSASTTNPLTALRLFVAIIPTTGSLRWRPPSVTNCATLGRETASSPLARPNSPWLGTLGAQFGHSRGSRRYPNHLEVPVPRSAPGVNRTPDLQVRSLTIGVVQPISHHRSPV